MWWSQSVYKYSFKHRLFVFFSPLLLLKTLLDTNILWVAELELNCESICSSPWEQLGSFFFTSLAQRELILCLTMPRFECSF